MPDTKQTPLKHTISDGRLQYAHQGSCPYPHDIVVYDTPITNSKGGEWTPLAVEWRTEGSGFFINVFSGAKETTAVLRPHIRYSRPSGRVDLMTVKEWLRRGGSGHCHPKKVTLDKIECHYNLAHWEQDKLLRLIAGEQP